MFLKLSDNQKKKRQKYQKIIRELKKKYPITYNGFERGKAGVYENYTIKNSYYDGGITISYLKNDIMKLECFIYDNNSLDTLEDININN